MKNLTKLFFAGLLVFSSCQQEETPTAPESNIPTVNNENIANQLVGVWYLDRTETMKKVCVNEATYTTDIQVNNLAYTNFIIEFTNSVSTSLLSYIDDDYGNMTDIEVAYVGGGSGIVDYSVFTSNETGYNSSFYEIPLGSTGLAFFGDDAIASILPIPFYWGGELIEITSSNFTIETKLNDYTYRAIFKKSNQSSQPYNEAAIEPGTYNLNIKRYIDNGVLQTEETFDSEYQLFLNSDVNTTTSPQYPGYSATYSDLLQYVMDLNLSIPGEILWSSTSNFLSLNSHSYKIHFKNQNNLTLRDYFSCNNYYEYEFIKVN